MSLDVEDQEVDYSGCYGYQGGHEELEMWVKDFVMMSHQDEKENPDERWVACIWGQPGIGKTSKVKALKNTPVTWNGKEYPGWNIMDAPAAQFEEMGDIHGLPDKCVYVEKGKFGHWVSCETDILGGWKEDGWVVDYKKGTRTMYSPPDFVPTEPGPSIILIDDANRTSQRILKGMMQLFQTHGTVSWKLPPGCVIVLTGNPAMQDFMVTDMDSAILTRMKHFTLTHSAKEWVMWATANDLDPRGISYISRYEEMMIGTQLTNPRSLSEFFRYLKHVKDLNSEVNLKRIQMYAHGLLDEDTVSSMLTFFQRDVELVIEPEQILAGEDFIPEHMEKLSKGVLNQRTGEKETRVDILAVTVDRLFAYMARPDFKPEAGAIQNFQEFATSKSLLDDMRHNLCMRVYRKSGMQHWLLGNQRLTDLVMEVV
jgi:MoxR-like ATPase